MSATQDSDVVAVDALPADWTAAEGKKLGDQSVWIGVAKRDVRFRLYSETHNVATRAEGEKLLASILADHRKRGDQVLVGFDFGAGVAYDTCHLEPGRVRAVIGMALGFAFFVADNFSMAMGDLGAYPPFLAAWAPILLFFLIGEAVLFRTEE